MIHQSNSVRGIAIAYEEISLSHFAGTFFLGSTRDCFRSCIRILQRFASCVVFMNLPEPRKTFSYDLSKLFVSFLWDGGGGGGGGGEEREKKERE